MLPHALGSLNLHSLFRWLITHSLNAVSRPRLFQCTFPASSVVRTFLECCLMPSEISIHILHSLNVASCPRQFQFIFPTPAVSHILLECHLTPLAISISIPCSGGHLHIP